MDGQRIAVLAIADRDRRDAVTAQFMDRSDQWSLAGVAASVDDARRLVYHMRPTVLVCELMLPWGGDDPAIRHGLDLIAMCASPHQDDRVPLIIICGDVAAFDAQALVRALRTGARAFIDPHNDDVAALAERLAVAAVGLTIIPAAAVARVSAWQDDAGGPVPPPLEQPSSTARRILALIAAGADRDLLAADLGMPLNTLKNHQARLFKAFGLQERAEAVALVLQRDLVKAVEGTASNDAESRPFRPATAVPEIQA